MSVSKTVDNFYALRLARLLQLPFEKWEAYELNLIDHTGKLVRKPVNSKEKNAWTKFHVVTRNLKQMIAKVPGGALAMKYGASYLLLKEIREDYYLSDDFVDIVEAVVAGDSGGSVDNIASGETTGAITNTGPKTKKKKVKRFKDEETK